MKPNIGIINALVRLTMGFALLSWVTAKLVKRPYRDSYLLVALLAAMKVAEGITRFCPLTFAFDQYQNEQNSTSDHDEMTYNPS
ncbi:YgaP family membrane protein [Metabacillus iocasae]|uniref:Inner membrane protein YgaP-like transmembrane domain-containing protein n=1 Tax=Priestia iocasae TaxID=2291674 RepID=A0ABS2QXN6_9BACI|nr:DUF2892 domain-containing protein [Metabacillus iocasae]MBM7704244.1 hypothetical protein [Metabacillus iocasae]